jgi:hypothetical protein
MMKKMLLAFMALSVAMVSCHKDDEDPAPRDTDVSYQPLTVGSTWSYKTKNNISSVESNYTLTATNKDTSINSKSYKVFTRSDAGNEYYYNTGNAYYQFGSIANITGPTELLYLAADVEAGGSWTETKDVAIPGLGASNLKVTYTVVEKLASYTVEGKAYSDVIHVKLTLSDITLSGIPVPITSQDLQFYYAAGVGRIKQQVKVTITGLSPVDNETNLTTSAIVP